MPRGAVIATRPSAGDRLVHGHTVRVIASTGSPVVTVPHLPDFTTVTDARSALDAAGLQVTLRKILGGHGGLVVDMDPEAGTELKRGTAVNLYVS